MCWLSWGVGAVVVSRVVFCEVMLMSVEVWCVCVLCCLLCVEDGVCCCEVCCGLMWLCFE